MGHDSPLSQPAPPVATNLAALATRPRHRSLRVLAGEQAWCCAQAQVTLQNWPVVWLGTGPHAPATAKPVSAAQGYLGQELDAVVFDAYAGFDPDAFGAIAGSIRAGGILLLLTPPLQDWPDYPDPVNARLCVHPVLPTTVSGRYLTRLTAMIRRSPYLALQEQNRPLLPSSGPRLRPGPTTGMQAVTRPDQTQAIAAIERVMSGHRNRPLLLQADRGRGKSAALGIAAAHLLRSGEKYRILLTAPRRAAVDTVFLHAARLLPDADIQPSQLIYGHSSLQFMAPDELADSLPAADLVLVDEAAGIHLNLLTQILRRYRRLVFSSTVHGYEGAGRGFALRFRTLLQQYAPGWRSLELHQPIRWDDNDPLERFTLNALLLDAEPPPFPAQPASTLATSTVERLSRSQLAQDETLLRTVFGLLVQAHYQTRPLDLRQLLDGPNLSIYRLTLAGDTVAVAMLADEGRFESSLASDIATGQRRPQGHQLAQLLAYQYHCPEAASLRFARVVRIAVHPAWQGQGYGSYLLRGLIEQAQQSRFDAIGAVFGASPELLTFWRRQCLQPVQIGLSRKAASGAHSVAVLRALSSDGQHLQARLASDFQHRLPYLLADPLRELEPDCAALLLQQPDDGQPLALSPSAHTALTGFVAGQRGYELVPDALCELAQAVLASPRLAAQLNSAQRKVLIAKLLQKRSWADCAQLLNLAGRRQVEALLREAVRCITMKHPHNPA